MAKLPTCGEYVTAIDNPQLIKSQELKGGTVVKRNNRIVRYAGGFCVVFPYEIKAKKYAVRCWHSNVDGCMQRSKAISEELSRLRLPYFVDFKYITDGILTSTGIQPLVLMDWVDAQPLKKYISEHISEHDTINRLAENFMEMVKDLHKYNLSHGDLQHGNILVKPDSKLVLVDYDSMFVPSLEGYKDDIKGLPGYQHIARWDNKLLTPKADYFSELVIYTSLKGLAQFPELWGKLNMEDTDTLLFSSDDIESRGSSKIFSELEQNITLNPLISKLKDFMSYNSLDDLSPLEDSITSMADMMSDKWNDVPYQSTKTIDTSEIEKAWLDNGYKAPTIELSTKW